ncbi:MAG: substrate-binding domain-containing protein, partial [Tetragenococcus halophilus]|nr:substrate-binding domain-containing protein [Tetragenococcus halophilus]
MKRFGLKKQLLLMVTMIFAFILTACGNAARLEGEGGDEGETEELAPEDITIGLSVSTLNNPFFGQLEKGVVETAEEQGSTVQTVDAQDDTATQINDIDDLIQQDVDILLINPVDSDSIVPAVESANDANIPVITLDRSSSDGEVITLIASDNVEGGEMAAKYIVDSVGEDANVVQIEGVPGASATNERGEGFNNVAEDQLNVLESQSGNFNRSEGLDVMENLLQSHSDIDAVFSQNDEMALGAIEALESAGLDDDVMVIGFDGNDDAIQSVEDGDLDGTVAQQPYD